MKRKGPLETAAFFIARRPEVRPHHARREGSGRARQAADCVVGMALPPKLRIIATLFWGGLKVIP